MGLLAINANNSIYFRWQFPGGSFPGGSCPRWQLSCVAIVLGNSCPRWQLSYVTVVRVAVVQMAVVPEPKNWQYLVTTRVLFQKFFVNSVQVFHIFQRIVGIVSCSQKFSTLFRRQSWHAHVLRPRTTGQCFLLQQSAWQCKAVPSSQRIASLCTNINTSKGVTIRDRPIWLFLWPIPIYQPITDISKTFKSCFALHYSNFVVFYALLFFKKLKNQDLWAKIFEIAAISRFD